VRPYRYRKDARPVRFISSRCTHRRLAPLPPPPRDDRRAVGHRTDPDAHHPSAAPPDTITHRRHRTARNRPTPKRTPLPDATARPAEPVPWDPTALTHHTRFPPPPLTAAGSRRGCDLSDRPAGRSVFTGSNHPRQTSRSHRPGPHTHPQSGTCRPGYIEIGRQLPILASTLLRLHVTDPAPSGKLPSRGLGPLASGVIELS